MLGELLEDGDEEAAAVVVVREQPQAPLEVHLPRLLGRWREQRLERRALAREARLGKVRGQG